MRAPRYCLYRADKRLQGQGAAFLSMSSTTLPSSTLDISRPPVTEAKAAQTISPQAHRHTEPGQAEHVCVLPVLSTEHFEQRVGLPDISGVGALGEPAVNRCQELPGFHLLALLLP